MPYLHLVYISRSDGALSTVTAKAKRKEDNGPTSQQLQKTKADKGMYSWYQELPIGDPKNLDWRRKLGGLLVKDVHTRAKESGTKPESGPGSELTVNPEDYVLAAFPENYRLFEHRRAENIDHSNVRGPNDRRDVYLYGHPQGRKKRFRSPADFLPHLIWLSTDESGDPENCACKLCTPDEMLKSGEEMAALQRKQRGVPVKDEGNKKPDAQTTSVPSKSEQASKSQAIPHMPKNPPNQTSGPISRTPSQTPSQSGQPPSAPPQANIAASVPSGPVATPLVKARIPEQLLDQQLNKYIYRNGELVWYFTTEGHLALGAIISRSLYHNSSNQEKAAYVIQPISQPFNHPMGVITTQEQDIKPWLAYSTPPPGIPEVGDGEIMYDNINWEAISKRYAEQALLRAGSICAARMIDVSYTLFCPKTTPGQDLQQQQSGEVEYHGMYLGGEMIWTGEAVRLSIRDDCKDIMIVSQIIERSSYGQPTGVDFVGDVYTPITTNYNPKRTPPPNHYLPIRVREDLKFRNTYSMQQLKLVMNWKLTQSQKRVSISQVKGRWYESRSILPATNPAALEKGMVDGMVPDVGDQFNARSTGQTEIGLRKQDRRQAFSKSLPGSIRFGMQFTVPQHTGRAIPINLNAPVVQANTNMSGFVNMDQMEQSHFSQNFMN